MAHTHIHLHEADEEEPPTNPVEPKSPVVPPQSEQPPKSSPPEMTPQAAKTAARRLGRTLKIDPQEGLREVAKYFGDEVAGRFGKIAELMGIDEAVADLEDHIAGMSEKKPMPGLGSSVRRPGPQQMPAARDAWEENKHTRGEGGRFAAHASVASSHGWKSAGIGETAEGHPAERFEHPRHPGHQITVRGKYDVPQWSHSVIKRTRRHGVAAGVSPESLEHHLSEFHNLPKGARDGDSRDARRKKTRWVRFRASV